MADLCSIAVGQTCAVRGNVDANVEQHLRLIQLAGAEGAQIVAFPELSLTGYELELARELAFADHDPRLSPLVEAAAAYSIIVIVGAPVRMASRLHIGALILHPDRSAAVYTKHHLGAFSAEAARDGTVPPAEATVFAPGNHDPLVRMGGTNAALAVCSDIGRPSHARRAADRGASIYLASMFVIPSEFEHEAAKLERYATRHSMTVALANFGAPTGGLSAAGRSSIWSATGERLIQLDAVGAGVAVASNADGRWFAQAFTLADAPTIKQT
jgi:predicted amidohydrolase